MWNDSSLHWIQRASVVLPVKAGEFCTRSFSAVPAAATSGFVGTSLKFGEWSDFGPLTSSGSSDNLVTLTCTAAADCFLTVTCRPPLDHASYASVQIASGPDLATVACFANNGFPELFEGDILDDVVVASLCVPVPKGAEVTVAFQPAEWLGIAGRTPDWISLRWLALDDPDWAFGAIRPMAINSAQPGRYDAQEDGFVFGVLRTGQDGARGYLEIQAFDRTGGADPLFSACAVHHYSRQARLIDASSVMLPVSRGKSWTATVTSTYYEVAADIYWLPLVRRS
jgi:hypothetical protein